PSIDTWNLVPSTGLDSNLTFICEGNFIGVIAIEGSPDNSSWSVLTQFQSDIDADGNPGPDLGFEPKYVSNATVRYLRLKVNGRIIRSTSITVAAEQNCDCQKTETLFKFSGAHLGSAGAATSYLADRGSLSCSFLSWWNGIYREKLICTHV
ncbi:MAG: hypothetical protein L0287_34150, partial [Anaerolineae bacterium]|nr:hypothetical protein [Anaerolineae bacterium]